ncbi:MAG TPA: hypothetical protein VFG25_01755 [Nitrosopumilaceae archaeon]|nr:hypothetical protein [Nitrosopumilaceae archaeon]
MKKVVSVSLLMLVASMVFSGIPISADAQTDLTILVKIASQAKREVQNQISSNSSDEIKQLFREASNQIALLERSLQRDDSSSAKQHFLNAMQTFKKITQMISSDRPTQNAQSTDTASSTQEGSIYDLERIKKLIHTLKSIAKNRPVNFDEADRLVAQAEKQIQEKDRGLKTTLEQLKVVLSDIQKELRKLASQTTNDRTIKFFSDMLDRLENRGADQKLLSDARDMLSDYEQQISDGNDKKAKELKSAITKIIRQLYKSTS